MVFAGAGTTIAAVDAAPTLMVEKAPHGKEG